MEPALDDAAGSESIPNKESRVKNAQLFDHVFSKIKINYILSSV